MQLHPQYYYQQLPPPERAAYHGMLTCLRELAPSARIPRLTMETLGTLFFQLRLDHPKLYGRGYAIGDMGHRRFFVPRCAGGGVRGLLPRVSL